MTTTPKLLVTTPDDRTIVMTRSFDAPRTLVFDAHTKPELVKRWMYGPDGWSFASCEIDLRVGGTLRYVWRHDDGREMQLSGIYREIARPERLVNTERFDFGCDAQAGEQLTTTTFVEKGGRTTLTSSTLYPSKEARDATLASGMEEGVVACYERLDAIVAEAQSRR